MKGLRPYPEYSDDGPDWQPRIPSHWAKARLRNCAALNPPKSEVRLLDPGLKRDCVFLPMENVGTDGVLLQDIVRPVGDVYSGFTYFRRGDVLVAKITPCFENGKGADLTGLRSEFGFGSSEFHVMRARPPIRAAFLYLISRLDIFRKMGTIAMTGSAGQQRVPIEFVADFPVAVPPPSEQEAIVRFLDWAGGRLDRAIRPKRKMVALLNDQKRGMFERAVTRGINPNVPLKRADFGWIGEIPAHWQTRRAKFLFREAAERSSSGTEELLSVSHINGVRPRREKNITMFMAETYAGHKLCQPGDLVLNTMWVWMGALGVSNMSGIVSPAYAVYRPFGHFLLGEFADSLFRTRLYIDEFVRRSTGIRSSRLRLYPEQFLDMPVLVPPASEQAEIMNHLNDRTKVLSDALTNAEREIALLREYRARLTSDVVTGKLDVRDVALAADKVLSDIDLPADADPDDSKVSEELNEEEQEYAHADD